MFGLIIKSIFSNKTCLEISKIKNKKNNIIAIITAFFSIFLIIIPMSLLLLNTKGSDWLNNKYLYNVDIELYKLASKFEDDLIFSIKKDAQQKKYLSISKNINNSLKKNNNNIDVQYQKNINMSKIIFTLKNNENSKNNNIENTLEVYFLNTDENTVNKKINFKKFVYYITNGFDPNDFLNDSYFFDDNVKKEIKNFEKKRKFVSFIIFEKNNVCAFLYEPNNPNPIVKMFGNYNDIEICDNLLDKCYKKNNINETLNNWKIIFDKFYNTKIIISTTIKKCLHCIFLFFTIIFTISLIIWLMNFKKNKFNKMDSFLETQRLICYASLLPNVLTLIFNFIFKIQLPISVYPLFFLLLLSIRIIFLHSYKNHIFNKKITNFNNVINNNDKNNQYYS